ncbi:MAG: RDD family protein [Bacilli bacterium]|nr:RDD family protein [Bacilli bacterium]
MFKIKRLIAFCIDLFLVSILTICITNVDYINPYMNDVDDATKAYNEVLNDYRSLSNEDEIEEFINNIQDKMYDYEHTQIYVNMWYIIFYFGYFVIFAYFTGGQTLGKKLMSIKIVKEDGSKVGMGGLLKRTITNGSSFFMGMNIMAFSSLMLTISMKASRTYVLAFTGLMVLSTIVEIANIIIYIKNRDNKCLNDIVSGTKVVRVQ